MVNVQHSTKIVLKEEKQMDKLKRGIITLLSLALIVSIAAAGMYTHWHQQTTTMTGKQIITTTTTSIDALEIEPGQYYNNTITINNSGSQDIVMQINTTISPDDAGFTEAYTYNGTAVNEGIFNVPAGTNHTMNVSILTDLKLTPGEYIINNTIT